MLRNQSNLQEFDLVEEIKEQAAEKISGGRYERFSIDNQTNGVHIPYAVDGTRTKYPSGGSTWTTYRGGTISFDYDFGTRGVQLKKYDLSNGGKYAFQLNKRTAYPYDIELYRIG
ncbi:MAG: hypothetical protein HC836_21910 [Richelia sp. RM2_1_2]|nr:hypothetical protein [Richelia sp. SM1_7_0]NJO60814.1 hypothetical protein [Richelia sp. RM2_1_2]